MMQQEPVHLVAWGVQKTFAEWARSPQSRVTEQELRARIKAGMSPEAAIATKVVAPRVEQRTLRAGPKNRKRHSSYVGVTKRGGLFVAQIRVTPYKVQYLGDFVDEIAAALAYDAAAAKLGKRLNFPANRKK